MGFKFLNFLKNYNNCWMCFYSAQFINSKRVNKNILCNCINVEYRK